MGNRRAERALGSTLRVDVDPLVVAGRVREAVDPLLVDPQPSVGPSPSDQVLKLLLSRSSPLSPLSSAGPQRTVLAAQV